MLKRPKRGWKWVRRGAIVALALVAVVLIAWVAVVPGLVRRIATRQLQGMGLTRVALQVRGVSLRHVQMANVAAGEGERLRIGAVGVGFRLRDLLRGRLSVIELTGLETEVRLRDGQLDLGPLAEISGGKGENPFTQIQLRSSAVVLDLEGQRLRIPVEGTVNDAGGGKLDLDLHAEAECAAVHVTGTVDTNTYSFYLHFDGEVKEIATLLAALPPRWGKLPAQVSGPVTLKGEVHRSKEGWGLKADASIDLLMAACELGGHRVSTKELLLSGKVWLMDGRVKDLSFDAQARGLAVDDMLLESVAVTAGGQDGELGIEARLRACGLDASIHMGSASGILDLLSGKAGPVSVIVGRWDCALDPQQLVADVPALRDSLQIALPKPISLAGEKAVFRLTPDTRESKTTWSWALDVPQAEATWRSAEVRLPASGVELKGVEAKLPMTFQATPEQATLRLAAGSRLTVFEVNLPWLDVRKTTQGPLLTAELGEKGLEAKVLLGGEKLDWSLDAPEIRLTQSEADLIVPNGLGKVDGCRGSFAFSAKAGPQQVVVNALAGCSTEAKSGQARLGDEPLKVGAVKVSLAQAGDSPLAAIELGATRRVALEFSVGTASGGGPLTATVAGADVNAGKAEVSARVTLGGGAPVVEAKVALDKVAVQHKASGLVVAGLSAEVPVSWNSKEQANGKFAVESIEAGGVKLANVGGTLGVADMKAEFTVAAEPLKGAKVSVEGSLDASRGSPQGTARLSLPLFKLEDENALSHLVPALKGLAASGTFGLEGFARLAGGQVRPTLTLTVLDGAFKSKQWEADADGVFATVRLNSLAPPLTPRKELQIALIKHAKMGKLEVRDGALAFRLEPVDEAGKLPRWRAFVQRAEAGWAGGRLYAEAVEWDPLAPEHTVTVYADDLKLGDLLALIPEKRATGVGAVSGVLPVTLGQWPDLRFGDGSLHSAKDQKGWLQIRDVEPLKPGIEAIVLSSVPPHLKGAQKAQAEDQLRERFTSALKEFEYDELKADLVNRKEGFVASVTLRGRGRFPDRFGLRQEFAGLVFNFPHLDKVLKAAILAERDVTEGLPR